ncbi:hypothetical protein [Bacillus sp. FJAT-22090]|uniref:hypothetical protein n=1 Tax=Bacillus sp. FJAT-22090 TaxID=1581038 RepID=UPI0011A88397|nr:hypothetical protein [Bacillus sp. FJAT-22090]
MGFVLAIAPVVIAGGIAVFVIQRLKHTYSQGNLGKKKSKGMQKLWDSLIPLGMLFGCTIGVLWSLFFQSPLLTTITLGASIGYLFGFFAYEIYLKKERFHS